MRTTLKHVSEKCSAGYQGFGNLLFTDGLLLVQQQGPVFFAWPVHAEKSSKGTEKILCSLGRAVNASGVFSGLLRKVRLLSHEQSLRGLISKLPGSLLPG